MASIDTVQIRQSSLLNPVSGSPDTEIPLFTHSVRVSGFEATELPNDGSSVFYVSKGSSTTDWTYTPGATIVADVTTVTVLPVPAQSSARRDASINATSGQGPFTIPSGGWNATSSVSTVADASGTEPSSLPVWSSLSQSNSSSDTLYASTVTTAATVTIEVSTEVVTITEPPLPAYATDTASTNGPGAPLSDGYDSPIEIFDNSPLQKRQICTLISATIDGELASWCNNWSGQSVLTYTSWETTGKSRN